MKKYENFQFLVVKFSIYLNRRVFVMVRLKEVKNLIAFQELLIPRMRTIDTLNKMTSHYAQNN